MPQHLSKLTLTTEETDPIIGPIETDVPHAIWLEQAETKILLLFLLGERERLIARSVELSNKNENERKALNTLQRIRQLDTVLSYVRTKRKSTDE